MNCVNFTDIVIVISYSSSQCYWTNHSFQCVCLLPACCMFRYVILCSKQLNNFYLKVILPCCIISLPCSTLCGVLLSCWILIQDTSLFHLKYVLFSRAFCLCLSFPYYRCIYEVCNSKSSSPSDAQRTPVIFKLHLTDILISP